MVQSEKSGDNRMLTLNSSDPFARKQGQSGMCGKSAGGTVTSSAFKTTPPPPQPQQQQQQQQQQSSSSSSFGATNKSGQQSQHGSWGPVFKNKDHFASLHFC